MMEKQYPAKMCFDHIGGKLGTLLMEQFIKKGWIAKLDPLAKHLYITAKGEKEFTQMGIDLSEIKRESL